MKAVFVVAAFLAVTGLSFPPSDGALVPQLVGGFTKHNLLSASQEELSTYSTSAHNAVELMSGKSKPRSVQLELSGILSVSTQVVAGTNYDMILEILENGKKITCHVVVHNLYPWIEGGTWSIDAVSRDDPCAKYIPDKRASTRPSVERHRMSKRNLLGGLEEADVTDQASVKEAAQWAVDHINGMANSYFLSALRKINKARKQLVNGYVYHLQLTTVPTVCRNSRDNKGKTLRDCPASTDQGQGQTCDVSVYVSRDNQHSMRDFHCSPVSLETEPTSEKAQHLIGQDGHGQQHLIGQDGHGQQRPLIGGDGHDSLPHGEQHLIGQDGHGQQHLIGQDGHGQQRPLIGGDGHDSLPHGEQRPLIGQDGHGQQHLIGQDGHGQQHLIGQDGHGQQHLIGQDGHGQQHLIGQDGHGQQHLIGQDGHGQQHLIGQDGHGQQHLIGQDGHGQQHLIGQDGHGQQHLIGQDGHGQQRPLIGGDGHDNFPHHKTDVLIGRGQADSQPHGDSSNLIGGDGHDNIRLRKLIGGGGHDYLPHGLMGGQGQAGVHHMNIVEGDDLDLVPQHKPECVQYLGAFQAFKETYRKLYAQPQEEISRFHVFCANMEKVKAIQRNEQGSAKYGATQFADLTEQEFQRQFLGLRPSSQTSQWPRAAIPRGPVPDSWDWRDHGAVTPVKNQGGCGSCWAFSTTGNLEGQYALRHHKLLSLSEQELVDCDKLDDGCSGGLPSNAYEAIMKIGGIETEKDYGYDGADESCKFNSSDVAVKLSGAVNISQNEDEMAAWLYHNGPISIGINAFAMQFYFGGIAHPWKFFCNPKSLDHGVLIVGYGKEGDEPYWIVKNSWGPTWGREGYYYVYRGDGTCGLNTMCTSGSVV